jgi:hypothetical protein
MTSNSAFALLLSGNVTSNSAFALLLSGNVTSNPADCTKIP